LGPTYTESARVSLVKLPILISQFMSRLRAFSIALLATTFLFIVTRFIFPADLYSNDSIVFNTNVLDIQSTDFIPDTQIYTNAFYAIIPWATLSPWIAISVVKCAEAGCLALLPIIFAWGIIVFLFYSALIALFIYYWKNQRTRPIRYLIFCIVVLWLSSLSFGVWFVTKNFISIPKYFNTAYLQKLQDISKKDPFPSGITLWPSGWNTLYHKKNPYFLLYYESDNNFPDPNGSQQYKIHLRFFDTPQSLTKYPPGVANENDEICTAMRYGGVVHYNKKEVLSNIWRCDLTTNRDNRKIIQYVGFLDAKGLIFAEGTFYYFLDKAPPQDWVPGFFRYYR